MEEWRDIDGYEGLYQVSNIGRVMSINYNKTRQKGIMHPENNNGYLRVGLCKDKVRKQKLVHRLVAEAFIPNPENKPCVDHIIPLSEGGSNEVSNLRWCTYEENSNNELTVKRFKEVNKSFPPVPVYQCSLDGIIIKKWGSATEAAQELGINRTAICMCCRGKRKKSGGYIWRYENGIDLA